MVSQRQIAQMLNMTQQAVSAALRPLGENETSRVAPETRKLVLETAERLGYRANRYASILKSVKSGIIALITGDLPYYRAAEKMKMVGDELAAHGYIPWHYNVSAFAQRKKKTLDVLMDAKVEGAIISWGVAPEVVDALRKAGVPMVSYEGPRYADIPWVWPDKTSGYHQLVLHLLAEGCQKIVIPRHQTRAEYDGREGKHVMIEALAGYLSGMKAAGRAPDPAPIVFVPEGTKPYAALGSRGDYQSGYLLMQQALEKGADAVMFPTDGFAIGGLCACRDLGVRVPEDVCITGLNNEPQALYAWVPITTLGEPTTAMVKDASRLLLQQLKNAKAPIELVPNYPCELIIRASSCRLSAPTHESLLPCASSS